MASYIYLNVRRFFYLLISMSCLMAIDTLASPNTTAVERGNIRKYVSKCQEKHPDVMNNPSSSGGVEVISFSSNLIKTINLLCIYGSLERFSLDLDKRQKLLNLLSRYKSYDYLFLNSTGGDVDTWLSISEVLYDRVDSVVVDRICISSCANYPFLIADKKIVLRNSLVIWHGGPIIHDMSESKILGLGKQKNIEFTRELANRTLFLYSKLNVNTQLLEHTAEKSLGLIEKNYFEKSNLESPTVFTGYALKPNILKNCYYINGINNIDMWYPASYEQVYRLAQSRSKSLQPLQTPKVLAGNSCTYEKKIIPMQMKKDAAKFHSNKLKNENIEYKFKSGDTIFALSRKYCIDPKELMKLNNLDDPKTIAVNTIIDIPQDRCLK